MYRIGIDLGGTNIKAGIIDKEGKIIAKTSIPTLSDQGSAAVVERMAQAALELLKKANLKKEQIIGVGAGCPGMIDGQSGVVLYSNNLDWFDVPVAKILQDKLGLPTKISNDANAAALGEFSFGAGKQYNSIVFVTLGTGVGGGIVFDGKLFEGHRGAGAEIGHCVIIADGEQCTCGRKGCFEAYGSATAIIRQARQAMLQDKESELWKLCDFDDQKIDGEIIFKAAKTDSTAKKVVDDYIYYLSEGITNIINILKPEAVILGGGVAQSGELILKPLQKLCDQKMYGGKLVPCKIVAAKLSNDAGLLGAACLVELC